MKRICAFLLALLLLTSLLAFPVSAEEEGSSETTSQSGTTSETTTDTDGGTDTDTDTGTDADIPDNTEGSTETDNNTDGDTTTDTDTTTGTDSTPNETTPAATECKHNWIYVEVDPTCTEYGAKGYYCSLCEGVTEAVAIDLVPHTYDHACDTSCNVCGSVRETEHKFSTQWSKNSTKHWHACTVCGAKDGESDHYPGPAATEEKAQYCLTCGLMMMPKKNHTHKYAAEYASDKTGHWYACETCEEKKDFADHVYDNLCDPDCNDCGYKVDVTHVFESGMEKDKTGHWGVCSVCGEAAQKAAHIPGPAATDAAPQTCTTCGYELAPALSHTHEATADWQSDEDGHWKVCACGEKIEAAAHSWDEGRENEDGTVTYICEDCALTKMEGEPEEETSFPWMLVVMGVLIVVMLVCIVALIFVIRGDKKQKGKFHRP